MDNESIDVENDVVETETPENDVVVKTEVYEDPDLMEDFSKSDDEDADEEAEIEQEDEESTPEMIEFNFGGNIKAFNKADMSEEVVNGINDYLGNINKDYTQKSQLNAEEKKALSMKIEQAEKIYSMSEDMQAEYSKGLNLRNEIVELQNIDIGNLWNTNPDEARRLSDMLSAKQQQFQQAVQAVNAKELAVEQERQNMQAQNAVVGEQTIRKAIPNFNENEVVQYAISQGVKENDAKQWKLNPFAAITCHKAMMYDKLQAKAQSKTKPAIKKAVPIKAAVSKGGKGQVNLASMTPKEYQVYMNNKQSK